MDENSTFAKFVAQKVNKLRWKPQTTQFLSDSSEFVTGSWDNDINKVCVWTLENKKNEDIDQWSRSVQIDVEPRMLCEVQHPGDVTELIFLQNNQILVSSSNGSVHLYKHHSNSQTLSVCHAWQHLHRHAGERSCPCVSVAVRGNDTAVTVGEDGRMCFLNLEHRQPTRVIEKADSCTMKAVTFLKQAEVAAVNSTGQLKVWDTRQAIDDPARIFVPTGDRVALQCLDKHPTQPHIVCTGGQDGALTVWDMRQDRFPVTVLNAHSAHMWEVKFHPGQPDNLLTCSDDGSVWHWDASSGNTAPSALQRGDASNRDLSLMANASSSVMGGGGGSGEKSSLSYTSAWLGSEASKHRMDVTDILPANTMPVNTLDIQTDTLLCGTDGEQIYTVCNMVIR